MPTNKKPIRYRDTKGRLAGMTDAAIRARAKKREQPAAKPDPPKPAPVDPDEKW